MNARTRYEDEQVLAIDAWRAETPGAVGSAFAKVSAPAVKIVERLVPQTAIRGVLGGANWMAEKLADTRDIKRRAKVASIADLRHVPLETCDELARTVHRWAVAIAIGEGGATGVTGSFGLAVDLPLLVTLSLRTIHKIGLCYGYECRDDIDRDFILSVLAASGANSREEKDAALQALRVGTGRAPVSIRALATQLGVRLARRKVLQSIPLLGAPIGAGVNGWLVKDVGWAARRLFQERWLIDAGRLAISTRS